MMTRGSNRMRCGTSWLLAASLSLAAGTLSAQEPRQVADACSPDDAVVGSLGIDMSCDCTFEGDRENSRWTWQFRSEPKITTVRGSGPARGQLRSGDIIVAIDGMLITTAGAGVRMANLVPGRPTQVTVRRSGRQLSKTVVPESRCRRGSRVIRPPVAPVVRAEPVPDRAPPPTPPTAVARLATPPLPPTAVSNAWFGFGLSCEECTLSPVPEADEIYQGGGVVRRDRYQWTFSSPPRLYSVDPGGPADRAGLRRGDVLTHVDGLSLTSDEGGRRLAMVQPDQRVRLVYRRGDAVRTTVLTAGASPDEPVARVHSLHELARVSESVKRIQELTTESRVRSEAAALRAHLEAIQAQSEIDQREVARHQRELIEELAGRQRAQTDMVEGNVRLRLRGNEVFATEEAVYPLRYSGVIEDVNVVVRSRGSVVVSRDESTGEIVITLSDGVIRMKPQARR